MAKRIVPVTGPHNRESGPCSYGLGCPKAPGAEIRYFVSEGIPGVAERTKTGGIASFKGPRPGTGHGSRRGPGRHGSRTRVDARHRCGLIDQEILPLNGPPGRLPEIWPLKGSRSRSWGQRLAGEGTPRPRDLAPQRTSRALELGANLAGEGTPRPRYLTPQWTSRDAPQNLDPQGLPVPELGQHFVREWTPGP